MDLPKISIVTCSYQQVRYLAATMQSVVEQDYPFLEYIVMDGGSTDGSVETIRQFSDRLAFWVSEKDSGQSEALDKGFARSTGDIQGWLCSDDLLLPGALRVVGEFFAAHPEVDFVFGDALWIDADGDAIRTKKETRWNRFVFSFDHNYLAQPSCFWRRGLYEAVGGLDHRFHLALDSDLWLRFAQQTTPVHLPIYLSCMRYHPLQKTQALKPQGRMEGQLLCEREWPTLSKWPPRPLRLLARLGRISLKIFSGGYGASVPAGMRPWLARLRTASLP